MNEETTDSNEWLTTRDKRKVILQTKVKKRHKLAVIKRKLSINVQMSQSSPPPSQLFKATKQSDIEKFFSKTSAKSEINNALKRSLESSDMTVDSAKSKTSYEVGISDEEKFERMGSEEEEYSPDISNSDVLIQTKMADNNYTNTRKTAASCWNSSSGLESIDLRTASETGTNDLRTTSETGTSDMITTFGVGSSSFGTACGSGICYEANVFYNESSNCNWKIEKCDYIDKTIEQKVQIKSNMRHVDYEEREIQLHELNQNDKRDIVSFSCSNDQGKDFQCGALVSPMKQAMSSECAQLESNPFSSAESQAFCSDSESIQDEEVSAMTHSERACLINSEDALHELVNFSVDTQNLSQYIPI